jgi:hypothetical protein
MMTMAPEMIPIFAALKQTTCWLGTVLSLPLWQIPSGYQTWQSKNPPFTVDIPIKILHCKMLFRMVSVFFDFNPSQKIVAVDVVPEVPRRYVAFRKSEASKDTAAIGIFSM